MHAWAPALRRTGASARGGLASRRHWWWIRRMARRPSIFRKPKPGRFRKRRKQQPQSRFLGRLQLLHPVHHPWRCWFHIPGGLWQRTTDRTSPGYVTIMQEMVHEARVIPLDGRPHASSNIRTYMGDPRGHWEGNTLVVETTNFLADKTSISVNGWGSPPTSEALKTDRAFHARGPKRNALRNDGRRSENVCPAIQGRVPAHARARLSEFRVCVP